MRLKQGESNRKTSRVNMTLGGRPYLGSILCGKQLVLGKQNSFNPT